MVPELCQNALVKEKPLTAADEYRQHAAECLQAARLALRQDIKDTLVSMAQKWNEMAERTERMAEQHAVLRGEAASQPKGDGAAK